MLSTVTGRHNCRQRVQHPLFITCVGISLVLLGATLYYASIINTICSGGYGMIAVLYVMACIFNYILDLNSGIVVTLSGGALLFVTSLSGALYVIAKSSDLKSMTMISLGLALIIPNAAFTFFLYYDKQQHPQQQQTPVPQQQA